jgi:hypothetical protein
MEFFEKATYENNLWLGNHPDNGLVLLDRSIAVNERGGTGYYFLKCSDKSIYCETGKWEEPNYVYIIKYLNALEKTKFDDELKKATEVINDYLKDKDIFKFKILEQVHNGYLESKNLPIKSITKTTKRDFRESRCWECRTLVDNSSDYECTGCGWIICSNCGACKQYGCK